MAGPSVVVRILGNIAGLGKSLDEAGAKGQSAGQSIHGAFRGVLDQLNSTGVLGPFGTALAGADESLQKVAGHAKEIGPVMMGAGAAVTGVGLALTAAGSKDQQAHGQLQAAVEATGRSYSTYGGRVDEAIKKQEKFGTTANTTQDALRILTQATGDPAKALQLLGTASDLAAAKHEDLATAATTMGKAYNGSTRVFKEFGIQVDSTKKATGDLSTANHAVARANDEATKANQKLADTHALLAGKTNLTTSEQIRLRDAQAGVVKAAQDQKDAHDKLTAAQGAMQAASDANGKALDKLGDKLKGQASASANTFGGHMRELKARFEDQVAMIGQKYGPAITTAGAAMTGLGATISVAKTATKAYTDIGGIAGAMTKVWTGIQAAFNLVMDANPIVLVIIAIAALIAAIILAYTHCKTFRDIVDDMGKIVVGVFTDIKNFAVEAFNWIAQNWPLLLAILLGPFALAVLEISKHFDEIVGFVTALPGRFVGALGDVGNLLVEAGKALLNGLKIGVEWVWDNELKGWLNIGQKVKDAVGDLSNLLYDVGKSIIHGLGEGIKAAFEDVKSTVSGFGGIIKSLKGPLDVDRQLLVPAGAAIMAGLRDAMAAGMGDVEKLAGGVAPRIAAATSSNMPAASSSSSSPSGGGPAVVIQSATFTSDLDLDSFMRRVALTVNSGRL